ncbi:methyl-accepting chemotaxis protein [Bradyrhizobium sp. PRIMUS42]|uniref:methyl-accepting chemotaxis protein n=1 Tax=Bradyrhizobium sp. PRIMUS42 TaxID=2908926 RepID=UPI001FF607F8|nr:cache domain-containing protein [Bradyrhizobium sp. PRIMUS42]MCJ9730725.1 cache domain-containing protein [Bradyrhizobium sp. PRIMUS42]
MKLLSHLKIRTKLASMVCLAALTVAAIIGVSAVLSKSRMMEDRVQQMRTAVELLYNYAQSLQDEVSAGKLTLADAKAQFHQRGRRMNFNGNQGYPVVYNQDGSLVVNGANQQLEGKITGAKDSNGVLIAEAIIKAGSETAQGGVASYLYPRPGQTEPVRKTIFARKFAPWNVTVSYGLYVDDIDADVRALTLELAAIGIGLMLLMAALSWLIARDVLGALERQKNRMQEISEGAIDKPVEETGRGDEIGRMAETLEVLRQTALTARSLEAEQVATKTRTEQEKRDALISLADRFDASVGQLVGLMASGSGELETTAKSMSSTAEGTNRRAALVGSAATEASQRVQTVAAAAEELSSSITEISRQVAQSAEVTGRAVDSARRTDTIVRALSDGAQQIEHVAELISNIAAQTNLLALNATIEAARAGDAGRGFAVVAHEVKALAGQTAKATADISENVAMIQASTRNAVDAVREIGGAVREINEVTSAIAGAVSQQDAATREISSNAQSAAQGNETLVANITSLRDAIGETDTAAASVLTAASSLTETADTLSREVEKFFQNLRAGSADGRVAKAG